MYKSLTVGALQNSAIMQTEGEMTAVELNDDDDEPEELVGAPDASANAKHHLLHSSVFIVM